MKYLVHPRLESISHRLCFAVVTCDIGLFLSYNNEGDTFLRARISQLTYVGKLPPTQVKALPYFEEGGTLISTEANFRLIARVFGPIR